MTLAGGIEFMRWAAEFCDDHEAAHCLTHPDEGSPVLLGLLEQSAPVLSVQHALSTSEGRATGLAPTVLVDLADRNDLVDLTRVARLDSAGRSVHEYTWHAVRRGFTTFAVVQLRIRRPARAELAIAFPTGLDEVRQLLEAASATGWMTISSDDGQFVLPLASMGVGLADCLNAEPA